jgi:hypothetical protein
MSLPKKSPNKTCRCGQSKKPQQLLCRVCWSFLPKTLRDEVWAAYKEKAGSERHLTAIRACYRHLNNTPPDHA